MEVLVDEVKHIEQHDYIMNGAILIISKFAASNNKEGVFWSLFLARMRYYLLFVITERFFASEIFRVFMIEFWLVVFGNIVSQWRTFCPDAEKCCELIILLSNLVDHPIPSLPWLKFLADAASTYVAASRDSQQQALKLFGLGRRWRKSFLKPPEENTPPFFGLRSFPALMHMISSVEEKVAIMRRIAETLGASDEDLLVRYPAPDEPGVYQSQRKYWLASAQRCEQFPRDTCVGEDRRPAKRQCYGVGTGYRRWVVSHVDEPDISCNGLNCGCTSPNGDECICASGGNGCTISCHIDLHGLSRCQAGSFLLQEGCQKSCKKDELCQRCCYLRSHISKIKSPGEHCITLRCDDVRQVDDWHFSIKNTNDDLTIYDLVLGDADDVAIT